MPLLNNLKTALTPEYQSDASQPEKPIATNQDSLRIVIGLLGISLPLILLFGLYGFSGHARPLESISHYFYTRISSAFIITLGLLAIILMVYKGKKPIDFVLSFIAGIFALCVVIFPTSNLAPECHHADFLYSITFIEPDHIYSGFHFFSAAVFLVSLALMSFFRFPQDDSSDEKPGMLDKTLYRTCGIIMILALLTIALGKLGILFDKSWFEHPNSATFWLEAVAVWAFGYSWLLKAGFFSKLSNFVLK
ncbi:hypothetical protein LX87_05657 [Larkinella arboricola]|uniref:DUF998 domain-containing protein n=1 Tax=Larkinella arboricola TaxID=643671 RepID=A0A327WGF5_LARAB|nr:hypothetical protein [Larkinella arboricola]RAJ89862.1 hypothetical protein LX87_05657 [Larkinella arboricola]